MASSRYSYDGGRPLTSPLASLGSAVAGSGRTDQSAFLSSDTEYDDVVVNSLSTSDSNNNFFDLMSDLAPQPHPPSPPSFPIVNIGDSGQFRKAELVSSRSSTNRLLSQGKLQGTAEGVRESSDVLKLTNSDFLSTTSKARAQGRDQSSEQYEYGGVSGTNQPLGNSVDRSGRDRLPPLLNGTTTQGGSRRASTSLLSMSSGQAPNGSRASLPGRESPAGPMLKRNSTSQPSPQLPSNAAPAVDGMGEYWTGDDFLRTSQETRSSRRGTLQAPAKMPAGPSTSTNSRSQRAAPGKEGDQSNGSRRTATGSRATTFVGVDSSTAASHDTLGRTHPQGLPNTQRGEASPSPTRVASTSMRSASSASTTRTLSDGDLRLHLSSRNPDRRNRSASEPSPTTDEDNAYFPFGLIEMPSRLVDAQSASPKRVRGVVEVDTSPSNRFKAFGKQKPLKALGGVNTDASTQRDSPAAHHPYDLDNIPSIHDNLGSGGDSDDNTFDYSALPIPSQRAAEAPDDHAKDLFHDGDYGDLIPAMGSAKKERVPRPPHNTVQASASSSTRKQKSTPHHSSHSMAHKPANGSNGFQLVSATSAVTPAAHASRPQPPSKSGEKPLMSDTFPMSNSTAQASARRFTFDGAKAASPGTSNRASPASNSAGRLSSPLAAGNALESSGSLSHSRSTRAPRPPSRNVARRADVVGAVVDVAADTAPSLSTRPTASRSTTSARTDRTSKPVPSGPLTPSSKATAAVSSSSSTSESSTLPSIAPASRRQSLPSLATYNTEVSNEVKSKAAASTPASTPSSSSSPNHSRLIKGPPTAATNAQGEVVDATLSPIASEDGSIDSIGTAEQNALLKKTLRQVQSSVRIRTNVDEAALLPTTNEPWPLPRPPSSIIVKQRVFDARRPHPRGPRMRQLPNGTRQANWEPPETHYTTTLADLAAYEDEEDEEQVEEDNDEQTETKDEEARQRAIRDFENEIWFDEDIDVDKGISLAKPSTKNSLASPLPPSLLRGVVLLPLRDGQGKRPAGTLFASPTKARGNTAPSPSCLPDGTKPVDAPGASSFSAVPGVHSSTSTLHDAPHASTMESSLNVSLNPSRRHGGIVVDEVEKVRRMREDSVFTPVLDDLTVDASRQHTPPPLSERSTSARLPYSIPHSEVVSASPSRTKSPVLVPRGLNRRSPTPKPGGEATQQSAYNYYGSASNTISISSTIPGTQSSLSEVHRRSLPSVHNDSLLLDANGNAVLPQSPSVPTFARIIAQRSGGTNPHQPPNASVGVNHLTGSLDSLYSEFGGAMGVIGSTSERKPTVTFVDDEPDSTTRRRQ